MKRYIKNVLTIFSIVALFMAVNVFNMPDNFSSFTYSLAEKYVFSTKEETPAFTVGTPTLVPGTKSDGTKYDQMYVNKLGEIRVPVTNITNVPSKNDFEVKVTRNNVDVTSDFVITKTEIQNKAMTIKLAMKEGATYTASSYVVKVSVLHEWEETVEAETTTSSRVKIIRDNSIGKLAWGASTNNWKLSSLQALLNGRYYNATGAYDEIGLTEESHDLISNVKWNLGGHNSNSVTPSKMYENERGTTVYSGNPTTWTGYVGLMYPSDYGYAVGGSSRNSCLNKTLENGFDTTECYTNDWLFSNSNTWLLTHRASDNKTVFYLSSGGGVNDGGGVTTEWDVRPTVYLDTDVIVTGGSGTEDDPYTIKKSSVTTNNLVNKIKNLAKSDTNNVATDDTADKNVRYIGKNPDNYVEFNGELWRIIGVMNNVEGNDGESLEGQNKTVSKSTSFSLVDKYYNFEAEMEQITNYKNNPSNKANEWQINLSDFENITTSNITYTLKNSSNVDCTSYFKITTSLNNASGKYTIKNNTGFDWNSFSFNERPAAGTYTFTITYSNSSFSNSRGTLTKTFTITIGGRDHTFVKTSEESHQYIRTQVPKSTMLHVYQLTNDSIRFKEDNKTINLSIEEFNKIYSGAAIQNISSEENGDVVYNFSKNNVNYSIYAATDTNISYIHLESQEQDQNGNIIDRFTVSRTEFETLFPGVIASFTSSAYKTDSSGDIYYPLNASKEVTNITIDSENKPVNASAGGEFLFQYKYTGLQERDFTQNLTYKIYKIKGNNKTEVTSKDGFTILNRNVVSTDAESGTFSFDLKYDNTKDSFVGDYNIEFYINDGRERLTLTVGFSLYEGEIDYYVNHSTDSSVLTNNSNKQTEHYIGFYLKKGTARAEEINPNNVNIKIYDSFADLDSEGNIYFYDLINYEILFVNKLGNNITYRVFEDNKEISGSPFTTTVEEFKNSKYSQAANLLNNYKFDATTGNLITTSTNYKENNSTLIEVISSKYSEAANDTVLTYKENNVQKESTYSEFKEKYPNMYAYLVLNFVFDQNGSIVIGKVMGNYRTNEGTKVGHEVTDQFNISVDPSGKNLDKAITILPKTEVNPQIYYAYVSYGSLIGIGHINNDPESLISKSEFPDMWEQNNHMTMMQFDKPDYGIEIGEPHLSNVGNEEQRIFDNINGRAEFDLKISDTFKFENKFTYSIYYHDPSDGKVDDEINWGNPIQTSSSTNKRFEVASELFNMHDRTDLEPYETTMSIETINGVSHPKGEYKIVISYTNNGVTNTGEQVFEIDGKYYGLVLDREKTDNLEFILNYPETKNIVLDGYYIGNYDNIDISMIQENSSGDLELKKVATNSSSGKFTYDGDDKFTYQIEKQKIDDNHYVYTFKLTNIKSKPYSAPYHLYFKYSESGSDDITTTVDFVVNPATYMWDIAAEDVPTANGKTLYFTKDIDTTYIEDFNQFTFKIMKFDSTDYVDVSSDEAKNKEFESVELIDKTCDGVDCTGKLKIVLKEDTDKTADYYLYSEYLKKDDETPISNLEELFDWQIANVKISGSYYDPVNNQDYVVDGFFKNVEDTTIDITLNTVQTDKVHWELNRSCLSTSYACEVNNSSTIKYNDFLTEVQNENKHLKLRVNADYLNANSDLLKVQEYALVLYYGEMDYRIYTLQVHGNYVLIKFGESLVYSTTIGANGTKNVDGLFKNKNGFIYVPVTIVGVDYNNPSVSIKLTDSNGTTDYLGRTFDFSRDKFDSDHVLDIKYLASSQNTAISQEYTLSVEYFDGEETFSDFLEFRLNEKYFNYEISAPTYEPNPVVPNKDGKITFEVVTEDIPNVQFGSGSMESTSAKMTMMNNAKVLNNKGEDVTDRFTKSVVNGSKNNNFYLTLSFKADEVDPGDYTLRMVYELEGYELYKEKNFSIGNYAKELEITNVEIISTTTDGRMHKNVDGTYRLNYESAYNINPGFIDVKVFNGENDITNKFNISTQERYIDIRHSASSNLEAGDFNVVITYQDDDMEVSTTVTQAIKLYGNYKQIDLSNLNSSSPNILADQENQYYTFKVNKQPIADDIEKLKWIITDDSENDVTKQFKVTNNLSNDEDNFKIDIIPFASPVGKYHVRLYLLEDGVEDKDEERMYSNTLDISIDDTFYKVNLNATSSLTQVKNYDANNKTNIYDRDGAKGAYNFTSTYPLDDLSKFTIAITDKNGKIIKELDNAITNNDGTLSVNFNTGALDNIGDYKAMVCINHLPYSGLDMKVIKFIPITKVTFKINNSNVGSTFAAYSNTTYNTSFTVEPTNATNKNFTLTSSNTNVATISGTSIKTIGGGSSTITFSNGDEVIKVTFNVTDRLSSNVYTIDHTAHTIFVKTMTKKQLTKAEFLGNIKGYTAYQILDASNKDITSSVSLIGTSMSLKVSGVSYKIIVIGDLTGDGKIQINDVAMLLQHVLGKKKITDTYKRKAAYIRKQTSITSGDVAKLYQFTIGKQKSL